MVLCIVIEAHTSKRNNKKKTKKKQQNKKTKTKDAKSMLNNQVMNC